jgi:hypothetical protein
LGRFQARIKRDGEEGGCRVSAWPRGRIHHSIDILFSGGGFRYYYCGDLLRFVSEKGGKLL